MSKNRRVVSTALAAVCLVCGLILMFNSGAVSRVIFRILGVISLIYGAMNLTGALSNGGKLEDLPRPMLARIILELVAGVILIFFTGFVLDFISFVVGGALLVICGYMLRQSLRASNVGSAGWWGTVVLAAIGVIIAIVMIFGGINVVGLVVRALGLALALYGGRALWVNYQDGKLFK